MRVVHCARGNVHDATATVFPVSIFINSYAWRFFIAAVARFCCTADRFRILFAVYYFGSGIFDVRSVFNCSS